jgi:hypothetical protein
MPGARASYRLWGVGLKRTVGLSLMPDAVGGLPVGPLLV